LAVNASQFELKPHFTAWNHWKKKKHIFDSPREQNEKSLYGSLQLFDTPKYTLRIAKSCYSKHVVIDHLRN